MSARAIWKGHLKIGMVVAGIKVFNAIDTAESISFKQVHRDCKSPVKQKRWCEACQAEVPFDHIVKGFPHGDNMIVVQQSEIDSLKVPSTKAIEIEKFIDPAELSPAMFDSTYFLAPEVAAYGEQYAIIRDAMQDRAGIGRLALRGREYPVAVIPEGNGLALYTLKFASELRSIADMPLMDKVPAVTNQAHLVLARQLVEAMDGDLDLDEYTDSYGDAVKGLVEARIRGDQPATATAEPEPEKVSDIMQALTASLTLVKAKPKAAKKAKATKPAAAKAPAKKRKAA